MTLAPGAKLGPYEIVAPLGAGGMGEVWRAKDTRLDRDVAIKVLPERTARDEHALSRFRRETKALAALSHPNILMILDVGEHEGVSYAVMELLEGQTLRERLRGAGLDSRKALEIAAAVADGLAASHARDIVHRDLKPENLFLTRDGVVKILDFGLARTGPHADPTGATVTATTQPGVVLGTVNYMSPEQVRGQPADARGDIFSLGCVLYEMWTGQAPFTRETDAETMTAILRHHPSLPSAGGAHVPPDIEPILAKCLEKSPDERFHSAHDLAFALRSAALRTGERGHAPRRTAWGRRGVVGVVALAVVASGLLYLSLAHRKPRVDPIDSIAVLPFVNASGDPEQEYFVDGMTDALIADLAKIRALKVISRTSAMRYKGEKKPLPDIARELKVEAVVEGSVLRVGDRVRITAQLIHAPTDQHLWAESYDRELRDVLRLHSELARTIAHEIQVTLTPQEQARMVDARPINPEAHQAYLKGRFYWNKRTPDGVTKALKYFEQAIALAPDWPLGYLGLADTYVVIPQYGSMRPREAMPKAKAAAAKALELDESLGEAHATLALIAEDFDWDWATAEREFQRALALSPNYATAHHWRALFFIHMNRPDEAVKEMIKAQELDPLSLIISSVLGMTQWSSGRLEEAETGLRRTLELGPDFPLAHMNLAITLFLQGRQAEAITEAREAVRFSNNALNHAAILGYMCAKTGQSDEARRILGELTARSTDSYVAPVYFARIYLGLGDTDRVIEWLEKAYQERDAWLLNVLVEPFLAEMYSDPRFADLVRRVGLPPLTPTLSPGASTKPPDGKIMLAVLPFENLSRDPDQEYFSDGLTEEMIAQLGRLNPQKLGVIARTSAMHYKNTDRTVSHIRRELGVDYVVEGTVRRAENHVRITTKLINVTDQTQVWADSFDRELKDILALQGDVALAVARQINVALNPREAALAERRIVNPAAHEAYLKGLYHWHKFTEKGWYRAIDFFREALDLDPTYAPAYVGLGQAYAALGIFYLSPEEAYPKAKSAALKSVALDDSLGHAHGQLAAILLFYERDWTAVDRELRRALDLDPNRPITHDVQSLYLAATGRLDEALAAAKRAQSLDPLSPLHTRNVGWAYFNARDYEQAIVYCRHALDLDPDFDFARALKGWALVQQGRYEKLLREYANISNLDERNPGMVPPLVHAYVALRRKADAERIVDQLLERSKVRYVDPAEIALSYVGLGDRDRAFQWLETAVQQRSAWWLNYLNVSPVFDSIRADPRFADLVRRVGLPPLAPMPSTGASTKPPGGKIMLVVLPFENLSRDPDQEYFSDGLTEEMIAQLGRLNPQKLGVIGRTSAMRYKGNTKGIDQIGRELGVGYLLEGSVRRAAERLRITTKLLQVSDQTQLWSQEFDRTLEDVLAVQADVAENVARSLALELLPETKASLSRNPQIDRAVHDLYLRGRHYWYRRTPAAMLKGIDFFNQVLQRQPDHARAYAALADSYNELAYHGHMAPSAAFPRARAAAKKAVDLDETLAEPHASLAFVAYHYDWDWPTVDRELRRAIELNPSYAEAHHWRSHFHMSMGRVAESLEASRRALAIDPLEMLLNVHFGWHYLMAREYDHAVRQLRETLDLDRGLYPAHLHLGRCFLAQDLHAEAVATLEEANRLAPESAQAKTFLAAAYAAAGRSDDAQKLLDSLKEASQKQYVSACDIAAVYATWGKADDAFTWLDKALEERSARLVELTVDPLFDPLRSDPRYDGLVRRVGLPPLAPTPAPTSSSKPSSGGRP